MVERFRNTFKAEDSDLGQRLDKTLAGRFGSYSRSQFTRWIENQEINVNGQATKANYRLRSGDEIEIDATHPLIDEWEADDTVEVDIVYENQDLMIVNKQPGLVVHPGAGNQSRTLINGILATHPELRVLPRCGIVHRLDKDTSGLMLIAVSNAGFIKLTRDLANRKIKRKYFCIMEGVLDYPTAVDRPIGRHPTYRTKQAVGDGGLPATTTFTPKEVFLRHTFVEAQLKTGRTHQIRVHAQSIGLPLVGDRLYGYKGMLPPKSSEDLTNLLRTFNRQALHAHSIELSLPKTNKKLQLKSKLPSDIEELMRELNKHKSKT